MIDVQLGDPESSMREKMERAGALDVTRNVRSSFYASVRSEQRYFWWQLPDQTMVAILVTGTTEDEMFVRTIEIGEKGLGIAGVENWRDQNLQLETSLPLKFP